METLASIRAVGEVPISQIITREKKRFRSNSIVVVITSSTSNELASSLPYLSRQGATVVAILLDAASFGGTGRTSGIFHQLKSSGIPVYVVKRGDDLKTVLDSRGVLSTDKRFVEVA
jgi:hypothetical protein